MWDTKEVIPTVGLYKALLILVLNIFLPGIGTIVLSFAGNEFIFINIIYGIMQLCTSWIIIGWIWAIIWSISCIHRCSENYNLERSTRHIPVCHPGSELVIVQPKYPKNGPTIMVQPIAYKAPYSPITPQDETQKALEVKRGSGLYNENRDFTNQYRNSKSIQIQNQNNMESYISQTMNQKGTEDIVIEVDQKVTSNNNQINPKIFPSTQPNQLVFPTEEEVMNQNKREQSNYYKYCLN